MVESGLYELLLANAAVSKAIAPTEPNSPITGIYFVFAAKGAPTPWLVIKRAQGAPVVTLDEPGTGLLTSAIFQFDSAATDYAPAIALSKAVREALADFQGELPDGTLVHQCVIRDEFDVPYEPGATGYIYIRALQVAIWYEETT